jgi:DNA-binding CsgD family transcriptional regulator
MKAMAATVQLDDDTPSLSARQHWALAMLATYRSYTEIADALGISRNTLKAHVRFLYKKLGVSSRSEAVARGVELGLISPPVSVPLPFDDDRLLIELVRHRCTYADAAIATTNAPNNHTQNEREYAPDVLA